MHHQEKRIQGVMMVMPPESIEGIRDGKAEYRMNRALPISTG